MTTKKLIQGNLIKNGQFLQGAAFWHFHRITPRQVEFQDQSCFAAQGGEIVQELELDLGSTYRITFDACNPDATSSYVQFGLRDSGKGEKIPLEPGDDYKPYKIDFTVSRGTDGKDRFGFVFFGAGAGALLRNVRLVSANEGELGEELIVDGDFHRPWRIIATAPSTVEFVDGYCVTTGSAQIQQEIPADADTRHLFSVLTRFPDMNKAGSFVIAWLPSGIINILPVPATTEWTRHVLEIVSPPGTVSMMVTGSGKEMMFDDVSFRVIY